MRETPQARATLTATLPALEATDWSGPALEAAARAHAVEVLAQVPVGPGYFDEFDPKWWDALREVLPDPTKPADPQDSALDELIDLLPPPLGAIVKFTREADKQMRSIKRHLFWNHNCTRCWNYRILCKRGHT